MTRRIGVHESVGELFSLERVEQAFESGGAVGGAAGAEDGDRTADRGTTVEVVGNDVEELGKLDVCVTLAYDEAFLHSGLSWVHSVQAGVDRFPFDAFEREGVALTSSEGIHGDVVGETVLGYLLAFVRGLHRYRDAQREGRWADPDWSSLGTLRGERICVVGLGTLGQGVVKRAEAFGMDVVGVKRTPTPVDGVRELYTPANLAEAIEGSTFVVLCVPLTEGTRKLIGREELAAMREETYLVNVARGPVVDERALTEALEAGDIAGAALDVFESEPLPTESALWGMDEVLVTPHVAAAHDAYVDRVVDIVRENLRRRESGESLANRVV